jgi:predicted oxidoreductase
MQVIVGSMDPQRLQDIATASELHISREEWYEIYRAAGNTLP